MVEPQPGSGISGCVGSSNDSGVTLDIEYGHDAFGNRTSATRQAVDATPALPTRTTLIEYGELGAGTSLVATNGRFPVKVTNAEGHVTYAQFDGRFGEPVRTRDANAAETFWTHDSFGRVLTQLQP